MRSVDKKILSVMRSRPDIGSPSTSADQPVNVRERALFAAIEANRPQQVQELAADGLDVNMVRRLDDGREMTPLCMACALKRTHIVRTLLRLGADGDQPAGEGDAQTTPLRSAVRTGNLPLVRLLIRAQVDVNYRGRRLKDAPILCLAMEDADGDVHDRAELTRLLVSAGAEVNVFDGDRQTPLAQAARFDLAMTVDALLEAGADPGLSDPWGYTPLHLANDLDVVRRLLAAGSKVDARTQYGETPLMLAILSANEPKARLLLDAGADWRTLRLTEDFGGFGGTATLDIARFMAEEEGDWSFLELLAEREASRLIESVRQASRVTGRKDC